MRKPEARFEVSGTTWKPGQKGDGDSAIHSPLVEPEVQISRVLLS